MLNKKAAHFLLLVTIASAFFSSAMDPTEEKERAQKQLEIVLARLARGKPWSTHKHSLMVALDHGADANTAINGATALCMATQNNDDNLIKRLVELGANANSDGKENLTLEELYARAVPDDLDPDAPSPTVPKSTRFSFSGPELTPEEQAARLLAEFEALGSSNSTCPSPISDPSQNDPGSPSIDPEVVALFPDSSDDGQPMSCAEKFHRLVGSPPRYLEPRK